MSITVELPSALTPYTRGASVVRLDGPCATVSEALAALAAQCPGVVDRVLTEQGALRQHVNIFVGEESVRWNGGLRTPVADGDTISIVAAVSGG